MPPLEALRCGIPVVLPRDVGMLDELPDVPGIYRYDRGNYDALLATVVKATQELGTHDREALAATTAEYTPEGYAKAHRKGFRARPGAS